MATYRVRNGRHHGAQNQFGPGDLVELAEAEAAGFLDKLELVVDAPAAGPVDATADDETAPAPAKNRSKRAATSDAP